MKKWPNILILFVSFSCWGIEAPTRAEKGVLFNIGEWFLKKSGHSYEDVEERYVGAVKNCSALEKLTEGFGRSRPSQAFKQVNLNDIDRVNGRSIGMTIFDLLKSGCSGNMKMSQQKFKTDNSEVVSSNEEIDTEIQTSYDNSFRSLTIIKKTNSTLNPAGFDRRDTFRNRIDVRLEDNLGGRERTLSNVILDEEQEVEFERGGGTLVKGEYKYKYIVTKNEDKTLRVSLEANSAEAWSHNQTGKKTSLAMIVNCQSLEDLEQNSAGQRELKDSLRLQNAVFEK